MMKRLRNGHQRNPPQGRDREIFSSVVPAYAGVDRIPSIARKLGVSCPRVRGGGPPQAQQSAQVPALSPRTRGWTAGHGLCDALRLGCPRVRGGGPRKQKDLLHRRYVVPAYAGVDRLRRTGSSRSPTLSPRTRGWTEDHAVLDDESPVVPAYAGVDRTAQGVEMVRNGCPRVRGGGPLTILNELRERFVVPAYAGVDRDAHPLLPPARRLSPRTRGWTVIPEGEQEVFSVVPAYAGVDRSRSTSPTSWPSCPRVRGGGPMSARW